MKKRRNYLGRNFKKLKGKDRLSKEGRSLLMSKIKSKGTEFEKRFILLLRRATKSRFSTNVAELRGRPDIVFERARLCVFLDSDFWHGWQYPRWRHLLKDDFWKSKIERNRKRDLRITAYLRRNGWRVLRLWEHKIKKDSTKSVESVVRGCERKKL